MEEQEEEEKEMKRIYFVSLDRFLSHFIFLSLSPYLARRSFEVLKVSDESIHAARLQG